jgi:hypothetical protein
MCRRGINGDEPSVSTCSLRDSVRFGPTHSDRGKVGVVNSREFRFRGVTSFSIVVVVTVLA